MAWLATVIETIAVPTLAPSPISADDSLITQLWSGVIGAVFGALIAGVATFIVVKWQTGKLLEHERGQAHLAREAERHLAAEARKEEHRDWLHRRQEAALMNLLPVLARLEQKGGSLWALGFPGLLGDGIAGGTLDDDAKLGKELLDDLANAVRIDLPLIVTPEIRGRFRALVELIDEYVRLVRQLEAGQYRRAQGDLVRYIQYMRYSIKCALHGEPFPGHADPPVLGRQDHALWTPPQIDPEDIYFVPVIQERSGDPGEAVEQAGEQ